MICAVVDVRGWAPLLWSLPWRGLASEGVQVEECGPGLQPYCSQLLVHHLDPRDTGLYSCTYTSSSSDLSSSAYVYVNGKPSDGLLLQLGLHISLPSCTFHLVLA